ncbi:MAG: DUF1385 domain-containing protein [Nitrospiraceae bacterium]|nr:DUF1385 domain-containing protein [Nitrospiraceae bacterium]
MSNKDKKQAIGGQAVIEGVMFKSPRGWAVAVREPGGGIRLKCEPLKAHAGEKIPFIRGAIILFYTLLLGIRALEFSAQVATAGEDEKPISALQMGLTLVVSLAAAVGLFLVLPLYVAKLLGFIFPAIAASGLFFNLTDGLVRVALFLLYIWLIGMWKEIGRIFEYHGAEHKVIHAYEMENGRMDMERIMLQHREHPRCGTSFLLIVLVLSILVFSLIPHGWPFYLKFLSRLVLIPFLAGLSYEVLKVSARFQKNPFVRLMVLPGLALQRLTTGEPDELQIEVSLKAFEAVTSLAEEAVPAAGGAMTLKEQVK